MDKRKLKSESSEKKKKERPKKLKISLEKTISRILTEMELNSEFCTQMAIKVLIENIGKSSNVVLSPISFQLMLSLIGVGSKGQTLEQLLSHLGSKGIEQLNEISSQIINVTLKSKTDQDGPSLAFSNGIWVDQRFRLKTSFKKVAKDTYKAKAEEADFATKASQVIEKMNSWVKRKTRGLITDILPLGSVNSQTALVLANAIYFKGQWNHRLDKELTRKRTFNLIDGNSVDVPFMTSYKKKSYLYKSFNDYKVLSLPYEKGEDTRQFSMYFFLPDEIDGLTKLLEKINVDPNFVSQKFELGEVILTHLWIPKFRFSFEFEASETIKEMGINLPFMDVADFSKMVRSSRDEKPYVSNVFHKSLIEVNEDGTEAAARTGMKMIPTCAVRSKLQLSFIADHPFMFMIREDVSGVVIFTGTVMNPL